MIDLEKEAEYVSTIKLDSVNTEEVAETNITIKNLTANQHLMKKIIIKNTLKNAETSEKVESVGIKRNVFINTLSNIIQIFKKKSIQLSENMTEKLFLLMQS